MEIEVQTPSAAVPTHPAAERALDVLYRAVFLTSLPFGILDFVLPIYGKRIGASAVQVGLFFSVFWLMIVVLRPLIGVGLDRYGRRRFFLAGVFGYAMTMLTFALADQVAHIVLARTLQGISSAFFWLSAQAMIADKAGDDQRGSSFGRLAQSNSQGSILGTFIGFAVLMPLTIEAGWKPLFLGYAAVGLASLGLAAWKLHETRPAGAQQTQTPIVWSRTWILLLLVTLVTGAAWALLSPVLMIYLQEKFSTAIDALALTFLPSGLVWALLPSRLGRLADRFGRKPLMILGLVAAALSSFLIPWLGSLTALAILWAFQALCYAAGDPAEQALVADLTGGDQRGRAYGLYTMAAGLGAIFGPLLGGWLYDAVGQAAPFYANGLILAGCALVLALFLVEPPRR